jgi:hypothetical protein
MEVGLRTPLLDFFRKGDVAYDVRLLAARGAIAPRAVEQLGLLALLTRDSDSAIRTTAETTLSRLPPEALAAFIARSDVPAELREFFAARGVQPAPLPGADVDAPFLDVDQTDYGPEAQTEEEKANTAMQLAGLTVPEKVKAALKGTREMRTILVRDPNRIVAMAVLSSPKLTEAEIETIARMSSVSEDVLRTIGQTRGWIKSYPVVVALTRNAKTPLALSMSLLQRLNDRDVRAVSIDRNVPEPLRLAARKKAAVNRTS